MLSPFLELRGISCSAEKGHPLFQNVEFSLSEGDILILQGRSGSGKSTLLKCIAHIILYDGQMLLRGSTPQVIGIPSYRTRVLYVPQRPSLLPGSPHAFLTSVCSLGAHNLDKNSSQQVFRRALEISQSWEVESELWDRDWVNLSGGEAQRIVLAVAIALNTAEVLLLDEPTSALDATTSSIVEQYLMREVRSGQTTLKAIIWITHSEEQGLRVGTRFMKLSNGGFYEDGALLPPV